MSDNWFIVNKKCSADFNFSCPVCLCFCFPSTSCFEFFSYSNVELSNFRTFWRSNVNKTFKDPEPKNFLKKLQKIGSCLTLGLVTPCCLEFKNIYREIHLSRPCFNRLRKTNWRTLLWKFYGKFFTTFTMRWVVMFCLDYVNRPIVKEKSLNI